MKIVVLGLWHLGCVTAACSAKFAGVVGLDLNTENIGKLRAGEPPVFEPGLQELILEGLRRGSLSFENDPAIACRDSDLLWVCYDTPVDDGDRADTASVLEGLAMCIPHLRPGSPVLISSQVLAGTCRQLEQQYPDYRIAYSPENLRLGKAIQIFLQQERIILGTRRKSDAEELITLLKNFCSNVIVVQTESAEMIKHAINSFLALSIAFMNEVSRLCELIGADAKEVETGLKSESRIGPKAYLAPGGPFAGGTLARDVVALAQLGAEGGESLVLIPAIKASNDEHKRWAIQRLKEELGELSGKRVAILGLTYKPHTSTLRRSLAIEICQCLLSLSANVIAYDPAVHQLPSTLGSVRLASDAVTAAKQADAVVICAEWPQFRECPWPEILRHMSRPLIIDANGFVSELVAGIENVIYRRVGKPKNQ